jgi:hypothetical protein
MNGGSHWLLRKAEDRKPSLNVPIDIRQELFELSETEIARYKNYLSSVLFAKANEPRFNGATFFAELGESVVYIGNLLKTFVRFTRTAKAAIQRGANPDETWLEWRYAIQPLMLTIEDVLAALEPQKPKEKVQAYKVFEPTVRTQEHVFTYYSGFANLGITSRTTTSFTCGAGLWIESQMDTSPWGGSINDLIQAGWEIVPASFIWDWFIGVGSWLASHRDTNLEVGNRYLTLVKNVKVEIWIDEGRSDCISSSLYVGATKGQPMVCRGYHIRRFINDDVHPPILPALVPGKISLIHKLDALALIVSLLKGLRR